MRTPTNFIPAFLLAASAMLSACGGKGTAGNEAVPATATSASPTTADTAPAKHHSKLAGAMVGAAAGHMLGGHAMAGAAAGALIQHERNKHNR